MLADVEQRHDGAVLFGQQLDRLPDAILGLVRFRRLCRAGIGCDQFRHLGQRQRAAPAIPAHTIHLLEHDPPEPARKGCRFAQHWQIVVGGDERFLGGIFGQGQIAQQRVAIAHRHILKAPDDEFERFTVALLGAPYTR